MKISIITVTFHSAELLPATIESLIAQQFQDKPELEYLVIDGGSTDQTVDVAESYRNRLEQVGYAMHIQSEPDNGIYDAMNKGIRLATGDVIGILNSGDWYEPETLQTVTDTFHETDCDLMYANIRIHKQNGTSFIKKAGTRRYETSRDWNHPTTFVKAELYKKYPFENLGIHDDYAFFLKMKKQNRHIQIVDKVLANFRMGGASNQRSLKAMRKRVRDRYVYCYRANGYSRWYLLECLAIEIAKFLLG